MKTENNKVSLEIGQRVVVRHDSGSTYAGRVGEVSYFGAAQSSFTNGMTCVQIGQKKAFIRTDFLKPYAETEVDE